MDLLDAHLAVKEKNVCHDCYLCLQYFLAMIIVLLVLLLICYLVLYDICFSLQSTIYSTIIILTIHHSESDDKDDEDDEDVHVAPRAGSYGFFYARC